MVIFDLDGVVLDSEPLHENAKRRILKEQGIDNNIDLSFSVGQPNKILWNMMIQKFNINKSEEELEKLQYQYILEEIKENHIDTSIGFIDLLSFLKKDKIKIGLASSSNRFYVDSILTYYNIYKYFDYIAGGDEVKRKKPEPDVYLKVLKQSGIKTHETIAVEDTFAGSKSALSAGLRCVGYQNSTSGNQDLSKCFAKINSVYQLTELIHKMD